MLRCAICGEPYWPVSRNALDICSGCAPNMAATLEARVPRDALQVDEDLARALLTEHQAEDEAYGPL